MEPWTPCSSTDMATTFFDNLPIPEKTERARLGERDARDLKIGIRWNENGSFSLQNPRGFTIRSAERYLETAAKNLHGFNHGRRPNLFHWLDWLQQVERVKVVYYETTMRKRNQGQS